MSRSERECERCLEEERESSSLGESLKAAEFSYYGQCLGILTSLTRLSRQVVETLPSHLTADKSSQTVSHGHVGLSRA